MSPLGVAAAPAPADALHWLRRAEAALVYASEVVSSYEEGGIASETGGFITDDLEGVRGAIAKLTSADGVNLPDGGQR